MNKFRRFSLYILVIGCAAMMGGCFGSFSLTRTIYGANRNVYSSVPGDTTQRKIAQSAVMWLFFPIYAGAGIADAVVFNVIEFWTGNKTEVSAMRQSDGRTTVALAPSADGREAVVTITRDGQVIGQERLIKITDAALEIRDMQGHMRGLIVKDENGRLRYQDMEGHIQETNLAH